MTGALTSYHSLRVKGSTIFFFWPFLPPFVKRLFLPTAIFCFFLIKVLNYFQQVETTQL